MNGRLKEMTRDREGNWVISFTTKDDFRDQFDFLFKFDCDIEIKKHRNIRSKSANAYFHVLVNKIAAETGGSDDDIKRDLIVKYGALAKDSSGKTIGFKIPATVDVGTLYRYVRLFDQREEDGITFNCYLVYKDSHKMDTKEMARLIDGAIDEAKALGIETETPEQLEEMRKKWAEYEARYGAPKNVEFDSAE